MVPAREGRHLTALANNHQEDIMSVTAPRIVVGVDDSPQGIAALAWAIGEAQACPLVLAPHGPRTEGGRP